jgi:hypothetical protein
MNIHWREIVIKEILYILNEPPQQAAGYLMVGSYSPSEASFGEYYPERFNSRPFFPNHSIPFSEITDLAYPSKQ